jgi:hypothetical protein
MSSEFVFAGAEVAISRQTPAELLRYADGIGLNGDSLVRSSRLAARIV